MKSQTSNYIQIFSNREAIQRTGLCLFLLLFLFMIWGGVNPLFHQGPRCADETALAMETIKCSLCGKVISGKYYRIDGKDYCQECYDKYPHCAHCGRPMLKYYPLDGEKFCENCYNYGLPRCQICGRPMNKFYQKTDQHGRKINFCSWCARAEVGDCTLCKKPLSQGKVWVIKSRMTGEDTHYCDNCKKHAHECYSCGLLVDPAAKPLPDGRYICDECRKTEIVSLADYHEVYSHVKCTFRKLGLTVNYVPELNVVGLSRLQSLSKAALKKGYGPVGDRLGLYKCTKILSFNDGTKSRISIKDPEIFILTHLPRDMAFYVLAHELGHAWYEERVQVQKSLLIVEGFAEWAAYQCLIRTGLRGLAHYIANRTDDYGKGFRKLYQVEKKRGFKGVTEHVTR